MWMDKCVSVWMNVQMSVRVSVWVKECVCEWVCEYDTILKWRAYSFLSKYAMLLQSTNSRDKLYEQYFYSPCSKWYFSRKPAPKRNVLFCHGYRIYSYRKVIEVKIWKWKCFVCECHVKCMVLKIRILEFLQNVAVRIPIRQKFRIFWLLLGFIWNFWRILSKLQENFSYQFFSPFFATVL